MESNKRLYDRVKQINPSLSLRPAIAEDAESFTALMNGQYNRKKSIEYFYWQFLQSDSPARLFVVYDGDVLAGCYGAQILQLSESVSCAFTVDLLILDAYRNRGIFYLLEREVSQFATEHKAVALTCLPNQAGMKAHCNIFGWRNAGTVPIYALAPTASNCHAFLPAQDEVGSCRPVRFLKGESYRKWRYDRNPTYRYDYVRLEQGLFAVVKIFADPVSGKRFGDIVDYECDSESSARLALLFDSACKHLRLLGADTVTTWALPSTRLASILPSLGFNSTDNQRYLCVKVLDPSYEHLYSLDRWELVEADSEVY